MAKTSKNDVAERYEVAVLANALDILFAIGEQPTLTLSTAEASRQLGISRSTAYRLLITMSSKGFVDQLTSGRGWTLGWRFFALAQRGRAEKLRAAAAPAMRRILEQESETVNLAVYSGGELVYIASFDSPHPFRMTEPPGETAPLHATSLGKAVLASLPEAERDAVLAELELAPITKRTVRSRRALQQQLETARSRGWAMEVGEAEIGVSCFGAAILDSDGLPVAAISVSVPDVRLDSRAERIGGLVAREARGIGEQLVANQPAESPEETRKRE